LFILEEIIFLVDLDYGMPFYIVYVSHNASVNWSTFW